MNELENKSNAAPEDEEARYVDLENLDPRELDQENTVTAENGLTYSWVGDVLIPNLVVDDPDPRPLGLYGRMRMRYLKEHQPITWEVLCVKGTLRSHCLEIEDAANARMDVLMPQLAKAAGATEQLKAGDPMRWVGLMNNCKAQAEEIIRSELIYS